MTERDDWPPARTDDADLVEHSKSFEWVDEPPPFAVAPYTPGGADIAAQDELEIPESAPDPTPVLDPEE